MFHKAQRSLLTAVLAAAACTGAAPGERTQPIIGGTTDPGDPSVVFLLADYGQIGFETCTAEVIAPHVLLTAGHCVTADPQQGGTATFSMIVGPVVDENSPSPPSNMLAVTEVHAHPMFDINNLDSGNFGVFDVAVAILADAAPVAALPYNRVALPPSATGAPTRLVGYGLSDAQRQTGAGTKRQTTTALTDFDAHRLHFADGQHQACNGDSGGPAFQTLGGVETIIGVTSGGDDACNSGGYYTRIDTNSDFIDSYVNAHDPGFLPSPTPDLSAPPDLSRPPVDAGTSAPGAGPPGQPGASCHGPQDCASGMCQLDALGVAHCAGGRQAEGGGCSLARGPAPPEPWAALAIFALLLARRRLLRGGDDQ